MRETTKSAKRAQQDKIQHDIKMFLLKGGFIKEYPGFGCVDFKPRAFNRG
ncbi:MAG: hypothetical protein MI864_00240 [Pseudomonadales bacterium]|nr:hypothetical protein [Pseudomonadales bacterium]